MITEIQRPFFLFLRSFRSDRPTSEAWSFKAAANSWRAKEIKKGNPKTALNYLLEPAGPLIEVGGDYGAGLPRLHVSDEEWWESALSYIIHATAIFVSPDTTTGLSKEIDLINNNHKILRRTFLIMEPVHKSLLSAFDSKIKEAAVERIVRWKSIREKFRTHGFSLPEHKRGGAVISLYSTDRLVGFATLSRYELYELLHEYYVDLTKLGSYDISADENCPCRSGLSFGVCHGKLHHF